MDGAALHIIQAPKPRMMCYELTDYEWAAISRCCRTRRKACVVWTIDVSSLRSGAPFRTTRYNRFVWW
jgi:hypothetical protein